MKTLKTMLFTVLAAAVWSACSDSKAENRYIDLSTGEPVQLVKDENTGLMVNAETGKPVRMYVDTRTHDTIWGKSGKVINGRVERNQSGGYIYIDDNDNGDYKLKRDGEGYKVKAGEDYKKKVEDDGDYKIKNGDKKIKVDAETGERKVKRDD
ncbi:MAG TPA: hypothetical protein VF145_02390 [Chitinophagaceae bacterium]